MMFHTQQIAPSTAPATQNDTLTIVHGCHAICMLSPLHTALTLQFTKNTQHASSKVLRLPRRMKMDTFKVLRQPRKMQVIFWEPRKGIAPVTQNDFRHHLQTHRDTLATQNDIWTCLETFGKDKFCNFPHRHGVTTGEPETRDETCWGLKKARLLQIFKLWLCSFKIDVSLRVSQEPQISLPQNDVSC